MRTGYKKTRTWRDALIGVLALHDAPWRWKAGIEAGLASGLPLALFTLAGQQSLGLITSVGAFTALYCSTMRQVDRLRALPPVGAGFVVASLLGILCSASVWLTVFCFIVVAVIASTIAFGVGLGPPGPMHFVLVAGISGHIAASPGADGAAIGPVTILSLVMVGVISAYLVILAPLMLPGVRRRSGEASTLRELFPFASFDTTTRAVATRLVVAVAIASVVSVPLGHGHAYWIVMVAGALLQGAHDSWRATIRAIQRVIGTILGVIAFGVVWQNRPGGMGLVLMVALLQCAIEVVVQKNYALALIFITPLALTISTAGQPDNTGIVVSERVLDTLLGAAIAMAVLWVGEWRRQGWGIQRHKGRAVEER